MNEIKTVELIIWKDANAHLHDSLSQDNFFLSETFQFGFVDQKNNEILRLVYGYEEYGKSGECDFINIPVACIEKRIVMGHFNTNTFEFTPVTKKEVKKHA